MRPRNEAAVGLKDQNDSGCYTLDSCLLCLKTKDKLTRLLMHLQGHIKNGENRPGMGNTIE